MASLLLNERTTERSITSLMRSGLKSLNKPTRSLTKPCASMLKHPFQRSECVTCGLISLLAFSPIDPDTVRAGCWRFRLLFGHQNHMSSAELRGVGISLASLYSHRLLRRTGGSTAGNSSAKNVLPCRQVSVVALSLREVCHIFAIH